MLLGLHSVKNNAVYMGLGLWECVRLAGYAEISCLQPEIARKYLQTEADSVSSEDSN